MNLHSLLLEREASGRPVTVGLIGAGKFGTMFLSQARLTRGLHVVAVADLNVERARSQLATAGWPAEQFAAASLGDAVKLRRTHVTADAAAMIAHPGIEVIVEATGIPEAGIVHAIRAIEHGKHIVMVNVEADALAGPLLARKAAAAGIVYSLAYGDQPALLCELVDLARSLRPRSAGGSLDHAGQVEVISSLERDGRPVFRDLRWGVYVTFSAEHEYVRRCFQEYGIVTDPSGEYASMYKPSHLIGLELGISVASAAVRHEATGAATGWRGDCVATAKRRVAAGEPLDGEGGYTVWGKLMAAADSAAKRALPIGLAHKVKLKRDIAEGVTISWDDVEFDASAQEVKIRREMEAEFGPQINADTR